jgi:hypothetical protein
LRIRQAANLVQRARRADLLLGKGSEVVEIDAKTASVARRWSTAPCKQPVAMAIDTAHHRLFSGCRSGVMAVSDYQAGKVVATVPIGTGVDLQTPPGSRNMGFDPTNHRVFMVSAKFGPAPAGGRGRGPVLPGSFTLMAIERDPAMR